MNIFSVITARTMRQNRTRTIVTIIGVILSTAMITAVTTFGQSFWSYLVESSIRQYGNWYGVVDEVSSGEYDRILSDNQIETAAAMDILGYAKLNSLTDTGMPYVYVRSISDDLQEMYPVTLSEGRMPENESEAIIPSYLPSNQREDSQTKIGDRLTLEVGERFWEGERLDSGAAYIGGEDAAREQLSPETLENTKTMRLTVVGVFSNAPNLNYGASGYELFTGPAESGERLSEYHDVYLRTKDKGAVYDYVESVPAVGYSTNESLLRWYGVADNRNFLGTLTGLLAIITGIIMAGSICLIYNAFSISLRERTAQFGLLSSVGATKKQLCSSLRYEALFVSGVGIPIGCISGIAGIGITLHFIGKGLSTWMMGESGGVALKISWLSVAAAVVTAFFTVMLSVWIPSRRIRRISPIAAIRSADDLRIRPGEVKTPKLVYKLFGLEGMVAEKNYRRDRKKYRSTVASLTMSIVLFTSVSVFGQYLIETGSFVLEMPELQILYTLYDDQGERLSLEEKEARASRAEELIRENDGVTHTQLYAYRMLVHISAEKEEIDERMTPWTVMGSEDGEEYLPVSLKILPDEQFEEMGGDPDEEEALPVLYSETVRFYNPETERYERLPVLEGRTGTTIEFSEAEYEDEKTVFQKLCDAKLQGTFQKLPSGLGMDEYSPAFVTCISGCERFLAGTGNESETFSVGVRCENHMETYKELKQSLADAGFSVDGLYDNADDYEQDRQIMMALQVLSSGFIILISLISVANVFNTISTNLMLRRKEFAMLRSVGLSRKGFRKMMCYECLIYGLRSIVYGIALSLPVSALIWLVLGNGADAEYIFPWQPLTAAMLCVFAVVGITMIYTVRVIRRENIIDELKMN